MIDLHCHLDLYPEPHAIASECRERSMFVLSVTTTPSAWPVTSTLSSGDERIPTALGLHPQLAAERHKELALFEELVGKAAWIGEIGLDGTSEHRLSWDTQRTVFHSILQSSARAGGRIMSIHSRGAAGPVIEALQLSPDAGTPVLHWFSGSPTELKRAVDLGCWFSVGQPMVQSKKGKELVCQMPRERVLTESDGPFVRIAGRAAHPWDVGQTELALASLWGMPVDDLREFFESNLARLVPD